MLDLHSLKRKIARNATENIDAQDKRLAESNKGKAEKLQIDFAKFNLPYYEWTLQFRRLIEGKRNVLECLPMWEDIYRDNHPWIMLVSGRQLGKTTYGGGRLAYEGTQIHTKSVYVTFSDESLRSFSNDKYRGSILTPENPELFEVVKGAESGKGAVTRVEFLTESSVSLVTDANQMHHVVGKSSDFNFYDEVQNLDLIALDEAREAQAWTQGKELYAGIGGYIGTEHHKLWLSTNQMHWIYDDIDWYQGLQFDERGLIWGTYLKKLLSGHWEESAPQNWTRHGYMLPQDLMPNMPRTIDDAIHKYHTKVEASLEYKKRYPSSFYARNVMAQFVKGEAKPFTKDMILKLFDRNLGFTRPEDVDRKKGKVYASADWGGGESAFTVPLVAQCLHPTAPIFKILYIKRMDEPDVEKQADMFINLCDAYEVDRIGIDAGGGPRQAQKVETTFADRCIKISYITRPDVPLPRETETDKLDRENRFIIDRTYSFDRLRDLIENPYIQNEYAFPRFVIPADDLEKISWIVDHFEAVNGELVKLKSTGMDYIRYTHDPSQPDDAVHSFNYLWIIQMIDRGADLWLRSF